MAAIAAEKLHQPVTFELSITNVDKPPLDFIELDERLRQLAGHNVLVTRAPRFVEKARLAPGCVFVVGVDTITRLGDSKYYNGDDAQRNAALAEIGALGCRFLVFGRAEGSAFRTLENAGVPAELRKLCDEVPEVDFREDISSTALRGA
jgi:hypothetical protein